MRDAQAVVSLVHPDPEEAVERLLACAIESDTDMLKPYHVLSEVPPQTLNPKPSIPNPSPKTHNPKPTTQSATHRLTALSRT